MILFRGWRWVAAGRGHGLVLQTFARGFLPLGGLCLCHPRKWVFPVLKSSESLGVPGITDIFQEPIFQSVQDGAGQFCGNSLERKTRAPLA